jgi:hypothetical protein
LCNLNIISWQSVRIWTEYQDVFSSRCSNMTYDVYGFQQEVLQRDKPPVTQVWTDFILCEVSSSYMCVAVNSSVLGGGTVSLGEWDPVFWRTVWPSPSMVISLWRVVNTRNARCCVCVWVFFLSIYWQHAPLQSNTTCFKFSHTEPHNS